MKKLILSSVIITLCLSFSTAQTEQGSFILGGSSNFSFLSTKTLVKADNFEDDGDTSVSISFSPAAGYFVADNFAVGLQLPISFSQYEVDSFNGFDLVTGKANATTVIAAPFARYYFLSSNIRPFIQGSVGFGSVTSKLPDFFDESKSTSSIFIYGFDGGVAFFVNPNVSVDLGIGYAFSSTKPENSTSDLRFINKIIGFTAGFNIFL